MSCCSGNSVQNSGCGEDMQVLMEQRKRKRMESNRESARRSRMRKQQQLDDLTAQITQLRDENNKILTSVNVTTQHYLNIEAENAVLRAQMAELSQRLESLNEMVNFINSSNGVFDSDSLEVDNFMNPFGGMFYGNQPIMASADLLHY